MTARWPRVAPVSFDDASRLIPGHHVELAEHTLRDLADDEGDLDALIRLAGATNARLQAQEERHPAGLSRQDMVFGSPYSKIVNGAFANPGEGARFHGPDDRGAWYCALDLDTCVAEVAHHRVRHLRESGLDDEADIPYRLFLADVHAQDFAWLDDRSAATRRCLSPDSYAAGQALGRRLVATGVGGIVYPSVRHDAGTNLAVLVPSIVGNVRRGALLRLTIADGRLASVLEVG